MTTMMSNVAIITTLPQLKNYFTNEGNIEFLARLMITLPSLSIALLAPFLGHLVYKLGRRKSAIIALGFFGFFGSAGLYLDTINMLLVSRAFLGISIATLMIISTSLVGDYFSGEARHKFMGVQTAYNSAGGVLFVIGGGFLSDFSWRLPFAIYLFGFILIPFVLKFLDENIKQEALHVEENLNSNLFGIYLLAFMLMLLFYSLPTQMPFLMINKFGASGALTGSIISVAFITNGIGALSFAKLKRKFSFGQIYLIGLTIMATGFIIIGFVRDVHYFFITSSVMGFGGGLMMTNVAIWMLQFAHHSKRIKSSGYLTSSLFLGQFFSPIIFHPIVSTYGVQKFFIIIGLFIVFCVTITIISRRFISNYK